MKRIISTLLAALMLLGLFSLTSFAKESDDIDFAIALGFIKADDRSEISADAPITRIELAEIFYNIVFPDGYNGEAGEVTFEDVPDEKKHIAAFCYGYGIMRGYSDVQFAPNDLVTHNQAVKAMVSFLGYDLQAESLGGYPSGYLAQAVRLQILSGNAAGNDKITYAGVLKMLKKAIGGSIAVWDSIEEDNRAVSRVLEGTDYLEYYRGIKVFKGVVSGNYLTGTDENVNYFGVYIGDDKFEVTKKADGLQEMLGCEVYVYYKENGGIKEAIYFEEGNNRILEIADGDIASVSKGNIKYYDGDTLCQASFAQNAALIYNGTMEKSYSAGDLNPFAGGIYDGSIKLIDADNNGVFETIVVAAFESVVVNDVRNNKIYAMYTASGNNADKVIDVSNYKDRNIDIINIKGEISNLSALRRGYVANICRDKGGAIKRIIITKDSMSGEIEEISYSGSEISAIKIAGAEFAVSNALVIIDSQNKLKSGMSATVFFNCNAEIALIDLESQYLSSYQKGFLIDAAEVGSLQKTALCVIYGEDGKVNEYTFAPRISFGGAMTDAGDVIADLGSEGDRVLRQVILYKTDAEGKISALEKATALSDGDQPFEGFYQYSGDTFSYNMGYKSFDDSYLANSDTIIFTYPDAKYRDDYGRYGKMTLPTGEGTASYSIKLYGTSKAGMTVDIAAMKRSSGGGGGDNSRRPYFIVSKVTEAVDAEGDNIIKVSGYYMNGITFYAGAFTVKRDTFLAGDLDRNGKKPFINQNETMPDIGDVFTVPDFSTDGTVDSIDTSSFYQVYDYGDNAFMNSTGYATTTDRKYYMGKVLQRSGSSVQIQLPDGTKRVFELSTGAYKYVEVTNKKAGEVLVKPATYEEILSEDSYPGEGSTLIIHGRGMGIGCYIFNVKR